MSIPVETVKAALLRGDLDLERDIVRSRIKAERENSRIGQMQRLQELSQLAQAHPAWEAAKSGLPLAALGAIPGALLGGGRGAALGAGLGGIVGGLTGGGRPDRALQALSEARSGAPVLGSEVTPRMKRVIKGLITES